ncbi:pyridoxal phosphate-dependent aminotransferase [Vallitalea okinawensis]|uniref:pyridoxal phosphate-dependent aminotransferase n=1 Tax=Vallitalea okinawensis TaxID=2078660 RepID=UPI000CFDDEFB|nr:histidinol-phosphate transaminase [Vallitalea okinawensis]
MKKGISCFHGSDLEVIEKKYNISKENIINYSGNVNPLGISPKLKDELRENIDLIASYPDRQYTSLRKTISQYTHAPFENILVGNGTTELISLSIHVIKPKKVLIVGPTYSEYEKEIYLGGGDTYYYRLKEEMNFQIDIEDLNQHLTNDMDLLILCNPNNPTSSVVKHGELRRVLDHCKEQGIYVLIDETYAEFTPDIHQVTAIPFTDYYTNLIILRGVSKFFSAPGLRLGYCVCGNENILRKINEKKNPWTINALASLAGEIMLKDEDYIQRTRQIINNEREKIYNTLLTWREVKVYQPYANFILVKLLDTPTTSSHIFENLIKKGLMIRDASSFPFLDTRFIRFCFLNPEDNDRLLKELALLLRS